MPVSILDCPNELIQEFLSHLLSVPPSLQVFRLGLTCRRLYEVLLPDISKFQQNRLREAQEIGNLVDLRLPKLYEQDFFGASLTQIICNANLLTLSQIWSLQGLVSRAKGLQEITFNFGGSFQRDQWPRSDAPHAYESFRAFLCLLEACAAHEDVKIAIVSTESTNLVEWRHSPFKHRVLTMPQPNVLIEDIFRPRPPSRAVHSSPAPVEYPSIHRAFDKSRLSGIRLIGHAALSCVWYPHIQKLLTSSTNLTSLYLSRSGLRHYDWRFIISEWNFPQLALFDAGNAQIAAPDLVSFLHRHPSLIGVDISRHTAMGRVRIPPKADEKTFLPNVESLVAAQEYLLPFFGVGTESATATFFPKLQELGIAKGVEISAFIPLEFTAILSRLAERTGVASIHTLSLRVSSSGTSFGNWLRILSEDKGFANTTSALHDTTTLQILVEAGAQDSGFSRHFSHKDLPPLDLLIDFVATTFPSLERLTVENVAIFNPLPLRPDVLIATDRLRECCPKLNSINFKGPYGSYA